MAIKRSNFIILINLIGTGFRVVFGQNLTTILPETARENNTLIIESTEKLEWQYSSSISPSTMAHKRDKIPLFFGGLFTLGGNFDGSGVLVGVEMALDHINERQDILQEYELKMVWNDTKCYSGLGTRMFIDQLFNEPTKMMIIGPPCSFNAHNIAEISHYWNLITLSYTASSPELSKRSQFPYFYRVNPTSLSWNYAFIGLMKEFGWTRFGLLNQNDEVYILNTLRFLSLVDDANITVVSTEAIGDAKESVANLKKLDAKIMFVKLFEGPTRKVFCEAYKQDMVHSGYVWVIYGWLTANWWTANNDEIDCTVEEMEEAILSATVLYVDYLPLSAKKEATVAGKRPQELINELEDRMQWPENQHYTWTDYAYYGYDATWVAALTLNKSVDILKEKTFEDGSKRRLEDFTYQDREMAQMFYDTMAETNFDGWSGRVAFTDGDRYGDCELGYLQGFEKRRAGRYFIQEDRIEWMEAVIWKELVAFVKDDQIPLDHTEIQREYVGISWFKYLLISIFAVIGMIVAVFFLAFNIINREERNVRMSSPNLNNIIIAGSILVYASVIVAGLDSNKVSRNKIELVCQLRVWLLSTGFVLAFGSMFSKTWRVYRVAALKVPKRRVITDYNLFAMVLVLFCIDVVVLMLWQILDPISVKEIDLRERRGLQNANQRIVTYTEQCSSHQFVYWLGALFVFKGLLLLFGTFLAWEIRKVTYEALNDSQQIGVCVYNTIVLCIVGVSVCFLIRDDTHALFIFTSCIIIFCATFTLVVIFVPKMVNVYKPGETHTSSINTSLTSVKVATNQIKADPNKVNGGTDSGPTSSTGLDALSNEKTGLKLQCSATRDSPPVTTVIDSSGHCSGCGMKCDETVCSCSFSFSTKNEIHVDQSGTVTLPGPVRLESNAL